jgi:thioester reductase-like protein
MNRVSRQNAQDRQRQALESRSLSLDANSWAKVRVYETETHKPLLGLTAGDYQTLAQSVTDIIHNAWPMSLTRPVKGFEQQFQVMANLIAFARGCSSVRRASEPKIRFQFISSIAVVGHHPFVSGRPLVPEERMTVVSVPPIGYGEAKLVCENMLKETLHRHPTSFSPMSVRLGQIAGSKLDGFWNSSEHIALLLKSSQTLNVLPDLDGVSVPLEVGSCGFRANPGTEPVLVSSERLRRYPGRTTLRTHRCLSDLPRRKPRKTALG